MISAIVLAAGTSSRMGEQNKLLLHLDGQPIVRLVVMELQKASPGEVIVVLGHEAALVREALHGLEPVLITNENFEQGMTSSIQSGVAIATGEGYMICLADMYALAAAEYSAVMNFFSTEQMSDPGCICIPVFKGSRGNPVIFSSAYRDAILSHTEPEGCRQIVLENQLHLRKLEMKDAHILQDLDSPDDYRQLMSLRE